MKKVLFLENDYRTPDGKKLYGGGTIYENRFAQIMMDSGECEITIKKIVNRSGFFKNFFTMPFKLICTMLWFKRFVKKQGKFDVMVMPDYFGIYGMLALMWLRLFRRRTKIVLIYHHCDWELFRGPKSWLMKFLHLACAKRCHYIVFACPPVYENSVFIRETQNRRKVLIGVHTPRILVPNVGKAVGRISYVGRIQQQKGLMELVNAMVLVKAQVPDFDLQLIGNHNATPSFTEDLKKVISANGLENNITFCGPVDEVEKNRILASSRFFVFPSHLEGYGMVILESMQFSLPVVAWDVSAMPYTVKHEQNGLLVPHNDVSALADAIVRLYQDDALLARLATGARATFEATPSEDDFKAAVIKFTEGL